MAQLVYGLYRHTVNDNGINVDKEELRYVDDVKRGLSCECFCPNPECGGRLVARHGEVNEHHFAHYNLDECEYGYQIGILKKAELIIETSRYLMLPILELDEYKQTLENTGKSFRLGYIDVVTLESCVRTHRRGIHSVIEVGIGTIKLIIELRFTKVNKDTISKYKDKEQSALAINLNDLKNPSPEGLKKVLIDGIENKFWIYNDKMEKELEIKKKERLQWIVEQIAVKNKTVDTSGYLDKGRLIYQQQKEKKEKLFLELWNRKGICPLCSSALAGRKIGNDIAIECSNKGCNFKLLPDWGNGVVRYKERILKVSEWCLREYRKLKGR